MDKKNIILIIACAVLLLLIFLGIKGCHNKKGDKNKNNIVIYQYKLGTNDEIKKVIIKDDKDIAKLDDILNNIEPLSEEEMVDLVLAKEIIINYNENIIINIQLSEKNYCYYTNKEKSISSLAKMPKGLYEYVMGKIK